MGVEDYLLTAVLRGVLAQRLVRRLCIALPRARRRRRRNWSSASIWTRRATAGQSAVSRRSAARTAAHTGYRGRPASPNSCSSTAEIERLIFARADHAESSAPRSPPAW